MGWKPGGRPPDDWAGVLCLAAFGLALALPAGANAWFWSAALPK